MRRCLFAVFVCFSSKAFAEESRRYVQDYGPISADRSGNVAASTEGTLPDPPQFVFEIRLTSASERAIQAVLSPPLITEDVTPVALPFETWEPHDSGKKLQLRSFETRVKLAPEISGGPSLMELSDKQMFDFIQALQGDSRSNIMSAPKLTVFCEQVGQVHDESKVTFHFTNAKGEARRSTAVEGTRMFVRATRRDDGEIEANAQIELHALPNRNDIPLSDDEALSRPPEQTVTTMALSGILKGETLHMAMIPSPSAPEPEKRESLIQRAGFFKKNQQPATRTVALVTVRRLEAPE